MTANKYEFENDNCCSPSQDGKCMMCGRHVNELEAFEDDRFFGNSSGAKLISRSREFLPGYPVKNLECRDCFARPGPIWAFNEKDRLGRPLTEREYIDVRYKLELSLLEIHEGTRTRALSGTC